MSGGERIDVDGDGRVRGIEFHMTPTPATPEMIRREAAWRWFAAAMERSLQEHAGKGDWHGEATWSALARVLNSASDLYDSLDDDGGLRTLGEGAKADAIAECVDVACSALILADKLRGGK